MAFQRDGRRTLAPQRTLSFPGPDGEDEDRLRRWYVAGYSPTRSMLMETKLLRRAEAAAEGATPDPFQQALRNVPPGAAPAAAALLDANAVPFVPLRQERQLVEAPRAARYPRYGRRSGRRSIVRLAPAFPGYLFFQAMNDRTLSAACRADHVAIVLRGASEQPFEVPPRTMALLLNGPLEDIPSIPSRRPETGRTVRITEGAFTGVQGTVTQSQHDERLTVLIDLLGGLRTVSVPRDAVTIQD
jgi:transcription antitermination factor NusG